MQLDRKSLDKLLALDDNQLRRVLRGLLTQYGIDPSAIPLDQFDIGKLRAILQTATDEDIARFLSAMPKMPR